MSTSDHSLLLGTQQQLEESLSHSRRILHQQFQQDQLIEIIKEDCEKVNIEIFRLLHRNNQVLEHLDTREEDPLSEVSIGYQIQH